MRGLLLAASDKVMGWLKKAGLAVKAFTLNDADQLVVPAIGTAMNTLTGILHTSTGLLSESPVKTSVEGLMFWVGFYISVLIFCWVGMHFQVNRMRPAFRFINLIALAIVFITSVASVIVTYAMAYKKLGIIDTDKPHVVHSGWDALYFSIVTFTTLGYGDFRPVTDARMIAASEALIGYFAMATLIAVVARVWSFVPLSTAGR